MNRHGKKRKTNSRPKAPKSTPTTGKSKSQPPAAAFATCTGTWRGGELASNWAISPAVTFMVSSREAGVSVPRYGLFGLPVVVFKEVVLIGIRLFRGRLAQSFHEICNRHAIGLAMFFLVLRRHVPGGIADDL